METSVGQNLTKLVVISYSYFGVCLCINQGKNNRNLIEKITALTPNLKKKEEK